MRRVSGLTWVEEISPESWVAYRNGQMIGYVIRAHGLKQAFAYQVAAIDPKRRSSAHGRTGTLPAAKRAVARAWMTWLDMMSLSLREGGK